MSGPEKTRPEKLPPAVDLISTENANYRVIRSNHGKNNTEEEVGGAEIFCFEDKVLPERVLSHLQDVFQRKIFDPQYRLIWGLPTVRQMFIVDTVDTPEVGEREDAELNAVSAKALLGIGGIVGGSSLQVSRRDILKGMGAGAIGMGLLGLTPHVANKLVSAGYKWPLLHWIQEKNVPFVIVLRNLIIAHKSEFVARHRKKQNGTHPTIALAVGGSHGLITEALKVPSEEREQAFARLLRELSTQISSAELRTLQGHIYLIPTFDKDTNRAGILDMRTDQITWQN